LSFCRESANNLNRAQDFSVVPLPSIGRLGCGKESFDGKET
jgi:hypothetical protein